MSIDTAADQKGAEPSAQPDPDTDTDWEPAVPSTPDGDSSTQDLPTICEASTPTHETPQLAHGCPAPVYMAKTRQDTTEPNERHATSL